LWYIISFGSDQ